MKVKSVLLPLSLIAYSVFSAASNTGAYESYISIPSTPALDGDVNSSWAVDTFSNEITIGSTGTFSPNIHKAIVIFDTTQVDTSKTIVFAQAILELTGFPAGMDYDEYSDYISNNIKIEVAGPFGFGGSHTITALDYYATPQFILPTDKFSFVGWGVAHDFDLTGYLNPYGQTQIALSLISNPLNIAITFDSGEVATGIPGERRLNIYYQQSYRQLKSVVSTDFLFFYFNNNSMIISQQLIKIVNHNFTQHRQTENTYMAT